MRDRTKYLSLYRLEPRVTLQSILKKLQAHLCEVKLDSLGDFQKFIRNENGFVWAVLCVDEEVKDCITQLSTHIDLPKADRECCGKLLARTNSLSSTEIFISNIMKYQLMKMKQKSNDHKKEIKELNKQIATLKDSMSQFSPKTLPLNKEEGSAKIRKRGYSV